ncbi:MAG: hypothetical protein Q8O12_03425 [Candidatus Omnitrophota bacterium]|nr:hypothetical protein [Candidatus Omnitrophota bacterium]
MSNANEIRHSHFRQFEKLTPEERIRWALSAGYSLWQAMPKDSKKYAERLRNGWKKYLSCSRNSVKSP